MNTYVTAENPVLCSQASCFACHIVTCHSILKLFSSSLLYPLILFYTVNIQILFYVNVASRFCITIIIFHEDMHIFPWQHLLHENIKLGIDTDQNCSWRKFATYFPLVLWLFSAQTPVICVLTTLFSFLIHNPLFINWWFSAWNRKWVNNIQVD